MHAHVEARVRDRGGKKNEERRGSRRQIRENDRTGNRRRGVSRRERVTVRDRDQRVRLVRAVLADRDLHDVRHSVGGGDRDQHEHERCGTPVDHAEDETEDEPEESVRADLRQEDEDVVQRVPAMVDDPSLRMPVPARQTGAICFVWSISCWRSNGLPTNACAPPDAACLCACSSAWPLNMITGIAPAPY
jgi:hypothetical protein